MPDYAGAVAAIKARLVAGWVTGGNPTSLIVYANQTPTQPFPPIDSVTQNQEAFLICEVVGSKSDIYSFGSAGNRFFCYYGLILLHGMAPIGDGTANAEQMAVNAAELFRTAVFYQDANGSYIRTGAPNPPDAGGTAEIEGVQAGNCFRVTASVPFSYFHRA